MSITSQIRYVKALDTTSTVGAGKTGLIFSDFTAKSLIQGGTLTTLTTEDITTLGTYQAPSANTKIRIKEVSNADPLKGVYEVHFHDNQLANTGKKFWLFLSAAGAVLEPLEVDLLPFMDLDPTSANNAKTFLNNSVVQTGDNFARIGAPAGASISADIAAVKTVVDTLSTRLSAARAGFLDNLNVGGVVASQADINALNQSASRRVILTTVEQYERPESSSSNYTIEARTYDGDGAAVNADSTPTLTATGIVSGSLAGNLSAATNPATGVYRWTYNVLAAATVEQIRFDISATVGGSTFPLSVYAQVVDEVASTFTSTDKSNLTAIFNKLPSRSFLTGSAAATGETQTDAVAALTAQGYTNGRAPLLDNLDTTVSSRLPTSGYMAPDNATITSIESDTADISSRFAGVSRLGNWLRALLRKSTPDATALSEINIGGGTYDPTTDALEAISESSGGGGGGGGPIGPGASACTIHFSTAGIPTADADVWLSSDPAGTAVVAGTLQTNSAGNVTFMLDVGVTYYVWMQKDGKDPILGAAYTAVAD